MPADTGHRDGPRLGQLEHPETRTGSEHLDRVIRLDDDSLAHDLLVLRASVAECVVRGQGSITVDLSSLSRISSVAVAALLWARRSCSSRSVTFRVENARGSRNRQVLQRCGLLGSSERTATW